MKNWTARFAGVSLGCLRAIWPAYLLASLLIFWGLAWSLPDNPHLDKSFHPDEHAALWGVHQIHPPSFNPHLFNWGTALLYQTYLLKLILSLHGAIPLDDAKLLLIGRLVVWLSAMGALTCLYLLGREIVDKWTARLAAILLAVLPGFVINSHYFKTDIPMAFWLLAALLAGYRLMATGRMGYLYALGLLTGYAISTKYSAATAIPAALLCVVMAPRQVRKIRAIPIFGVCVGAAFLIGTPRVLPNPREFLDTLHWVAGIGRAAYPSTFARGPAWRDYLLRIAPLATTLPIWLAAGPGMVVLTVRRGRGLVGSGKRRGGEEGGYWV